MNKKKVKHNLIYPQPKESLTKIARDLFTPVKNRLCHTCFFLSGTGKRVLIKFLLREKDILKQLFGKSYEKTLFVYVNPDEVLDVTNESYLKLILQNLVLVMREKKIKEISDNRGGLNVLMSIKKNVEYLINHDWHVVFLLNDFEFTLQLSPSIFRNLESILALKKSQVTYLFLSTINLLEEETLSKFHNLKYAINRIVYYYPMMDDKQIEYTFSQLAEKLKITLDNPIKKTLRELCGGHVQLLKYSTTILAEAGGDYLKSPKKAKEYLLNYEQLHTVCNDIWNYFNSKEKEILINVAKTRKIPPTLTSEADFLIKTGVIKPKEKNNYSFFSEFCLHFLQRQIVPQKLSYDAKVNQIFYGVQPCSDKFTFQEFKLLAHFLQNEGKVVSRDEVGQILWGKNYVEQYSDWSIDKIISTIRKKLDVMNFPSHKLITLKKRGFTFAN